MRSDVQSDWEQSDKIFRGKAWSRIGKEWDVFKGAQLLEEDGRLQAELDWHAGTDFHVRAMNGQLFFIASRCQKLLGHHTFTIRSKRITGSKTELIKMVEAERDGAVRATHATQAYYDPVLQVIVNVYGVRMRDLLANLDIGVYKRAVVDGVRENEFLAVPVKAYEDYPVGLVDRGVRVWHSTYQTPSLYLKARQLQLDGKLNWSTNDSRWTDLLMEKEVQLVWQNRPSASSVVNRAKEKRLF